MTENLRAIGLMVAAMTGFALEDMVIKLISPPIPQGQVLLLMGLAGLPVFALLTRSQGQSMFQPGFLHPAVLGRNGAEMLGTAGFILAITLVPLTLATAVFQALPLAVTAGAAIFLGERVGWRRWTAIAVGFLGVLIVVRPGLDGFRPAILWAVLAVVGLGARDLFTRVVPRAVPSLVLAGWAYVAVALIGAIMLALSGGAVWPTPQEWLGLGCAFTLGLVSYVLLTMATRAGDVSTVMPFRYVRLIVALAIGALVFRERPDVLTWAGMALVIASGLYTFARERALSKAAHSG